jgi:nucleoside-diphosphate-sugar epimerase
MFTDNIKFIPERRGDRRYGKADIESTMKALGWKANMTVERWISQIKQSQNQL